MDTTEELNGTYFCGGYTKVTHVQLFWLAGVQVVSEHPDLAAADAAMILAGQPLITDPCKAAGCDQRHLSRLTDLPIPAELPFSAGDVTACPQWQNHQSAARKLDQSSGCIRWPQCPLAGLDNDVYHGL